MLQIVRSLPMWIYNAAKNWYATLLREGSYWIYKNAAIHGARLSDLHVPLPQVGLYCGDKKTLGKGKTADKKWNIIMDTLPNNISSALDIGCYNGFFSLKLAARGIFTIGVDPNKELLKLAQLAALEGNSSKVAFSPMALDPNTVRLLPTVDVTLVLSVMHYWIEWYGWKTAIEMLHSIWKRTKVCLYFEIPNPCENSKMAPYLSEMGSTETACRDFIRGILASLGACEVVFLDFIPTDFRGSERRHMFMVKRIP